MTATAVVPNEGSSAPTTVLDHLGGRERALKKERELRGQIFRPPPKITIDEWADRYAVLPSTGSAEPGKWRTDRVPYMRGIMQAISEPTVQEVAIMAAAQMAKTAVLLNITGYYIDQDPAPILFVQASLDDAREFSRDRLKPFIDETPALRKKVTDAGARRDATETMLWKEYPGGNLALVGANSPTGLARRPRRVVIFDEVDKYPATAGDKGDPLALGKQRTRTFWNRKIIYSTTPGVKGVSKIEKKFAESDQRRFFVPCPHCDHRQVLRFDQIDKDTGGYVCEGCGVVIDERFKNGMVTRGEWRATNPAGRYPGFHISALYSPWTTWAELVAKEKTAKLDPETHKQFKNEELAELWDPQDGEHVESDQLKARREYYAAEVPAGVGVLVAFVDVQRDRLELAVKGYGDRQESWLIAHHRIVGDTKQPDVWARLDPLLLKAYKHELGVNLNITCCGVDSGDGDNIVPVYSFVGPRQNRLICPVRATKGSSLRGRPIIAGRPSKPNKAYKVRVYPIGTDTAKDVIFARLKQKRPDDGSPMPGGFMHFPQIAIDGGADDEYLDQFTREIALLRYERGVPVRVYTVVPDGARNEAIDLEVGCLHQLHTLGAGVYDQLGVWVGKIRAQAARMKKAAASAPATAAAPSSETPGAPAASIPVPAPPAALAPRRPPGRSGFATSWKKW